MAVEDGEDNNDVNVSRKNATHERKFQQLNGTISDFIDENNSGAEGSASEDCFDKMHKESDPLQPKVIKSRSSHKIKESKEVS